MKVILFGNEEVPKEGEMFVVKEAFEFIDGNLVHHTAIILEPVFLSAGIELKKLSFIDKEQEDDE